MANRYFHSFASVILVLLVFFSRASFGQEKFETYTLCKNGKTVRTIRIEKAKGGVWVAYYTKLGVDKEVARAQSLDSCRKVVDNIKENLVKANWTCKELENVSSTTAEDTN